jgi:hypothetical protein
LALTRAKGAEDGKGAPKENVARCSPGSKEHVTWNLNKIIANSERWCGKFSKILMSWGVFQKFSGATPTIT